MKTIQLFASAMLITFVMASCSKENTSKPVNTLIDKLVQDVPADPIIGIGTDGRPFGYNKFTFYSFETNSVVPSTDSASTKWDVAFRGSTIITNGGASGPGNGGAFVYQGIFDDLKTISADSTFKLDQSLAATAVGKSWYVYDAPNNLFIPTPGRIVVIRTASGKFAKMEILNYYKGGVTPAVSAPSDEKLQKQRYYTFRFAYQSDGTKIFTK
ncbi:MAG: hypothetical protein FJX83_04850 [Bacteroidetes bacterium]|nr:hypothetical protein [Bacteroidota bacterium]